MFWIFYNQKIHKSDHSWSMKAKIWENMWKNDQFKLTTLDLSYNSSSDSERRRSQMHSKSIRHWRLLIHHITTSAPKEQRRWQMLLLSIYPITTSDPTELRWSQKCWKSTCTWRLLIFQIKTISIEEAKEITEALKMNKSLTTLDLYNNKRDLRIAQNLQALDDSWFILEQHRRCWRKETTLVLKINNYRRCWCK